MPSAASQPDPPVIGRAGHPAHPRRILAVQTQRIGDVLCFVPLLTALRRRFPAARLTALVQPPADQLLRGHPDLDQIHVHDPSVVRGRALRVAALAVQLRRERFDWALVIHAASSVSWAIWAAGVPWRTCVWRYGPSRPPAWHALYTQGAIQCRQHGAKHEVEYNLDVLRALGIESRHTGVRIVIPAEAEDAAMEAV